MSDRLPLDGTGRTERTSAQHPVSHTDQSSGEPSTESKPTVLIVDDDKAVRESLRVLIGSVGLNAETYGSPREFLRDYASDGPGCLVLDIRLPGMSGIDVLETLALRGIDIPVIIVTGHSDVSTAVRAMKRGAVDYFEKPFSSQLLLDRIQQCVERDAENRRDRALRDELCARRSTLTPREREVMDLVTAGESNKAIARKLEIGTKTVEAHRAKVMQKMRANSVADLVKLALSATCILGHRNDEPVVTTMNVYSPLSPTSDRESQ